MAAYPRIVIIITPTGWRILTVAAVAGFAVTACASSTPRPTPPSATTAAGSARDTTSDNSSVSVPNVPRLVIDRLPHFIPRAKSEATVAEATAEHTARSSGIDTAWVGPYALELQGSVLAMVDDGQGSGSQLNWLFVYHSAMPMFPAGCLQTGNACRGHYAFAGVNAHTGTVDQYLVGMVAGS